LPIWFLGYVKQASCRLKEGSNAHDKPSIFELKFDGTGLPYFNHASPLSSSHLSSETLIWVALPQAAIIALSVEQIPILWLSIG
jgi:hypothetical protein